MRTVTALTAGGFAVAPIRGVTQGNRMMLVADPDGHKFELVQRGLYR